MNILKSRTVWTAIVLILVNGVPSIKNLIPISIIPLVDAILGLLAIYFHVNPVQKF